jgi:hypothetical protein
MQRPLGRVAEQGLMESKKLFQNGQYYTEKGVALLCGLKSLT